MIRTAGTDEGDQPLPDFHRGDLLCPTPLACHRAQRCLLDFDAEDDLTCLPAPLPANQIEVRGHRFTTGVIGPRCIYCGQMDGTAASAALCRDNPERKKRDEALGTAVTRTLPSRNWPVF